MAAPDTSRYLLTVADPINLPNSRVLTAGTGVGFTDGGAGSTFTVAVTGRLLALAGLSTNGVVCTYGLGHTLGVSGFQSTSSINWSGGTSAGTSWQAAVVNDTSTQRIISNTIVGEVVGTPVTSSTLLLEAGDGMSITLTNDSGRAKYTIANDGSGGTSAPDNATYITATDQTTALPNSVIISDYYPWLPNQGGTGIESFVRGDIMWANGVDSLTKLADPGDDGKYLGWDETGGTGLAWMTLPDAAPTTATYITATDETTALPNSVIISDYYPWLPTQGGTGIESYARGDVIWASAADTLAALPSPGAEGKYLGWDETGGTGLAWMTLPAATGTVTSVALSAPNSNAILGGTNPITTSGTISINVGMPVFSDRTNGSLYICRTQPQVYTSPSNVFVMPGIGPYNISGLTGRNISVGGGLESITSGSNNLCVGHQSLTFLTTATNNIVVGNSTGGQSTTDGYLTDGILLGHNVLNVNTTGGVESPVIAGHNSFQYVEGAIMGTCSYGFGVASDAAHATSTFQDCAFVGNEILTNHTATHIACTFLGKGQDIKAAATVTNRSAVGAGATLYDDYHVQLGENCAIGIDGHNSAPPVISESRVAIWLDESANGLLKCKGNTDARTGAFSLLKDGYTCGTVTLSAGVNPTASVSTTAGTSGTPLVSLTIRPTTPGGSLAGVTFGPVASQSLTGSGFSIIMSGTLSADVNVDWKLEQTT